MPNTAEKSTLENYIEQTYEFSAGQIACNEKYQGILGRVRAEQDRTEAEKQAPLDQEGQEECPYTLGSDALGHHFSMLAIEENFDRTSFSAALMRLINEKRLDAVDVYKKARIDRKLFSKIRSQTNYIPSKRTIISLAFGMELTLEETQGLLQRAGFSLSRAILFDVIIEYFLLHSDHNLDMVNEALYKNGLAPLN